MSTIELSTYLFLGPLKSIINMLDSLAKEHGDDAILDIDLIEYDPAIEITLQINKQRLEEELRTLRQRVRYTENAIAELRKKKELINSQIKKEAEELKPLRTKINQLKEILGED